MIKLICFDFDGVLADCCTIHKISLNKSIEEIVGKEFIISDEEHYKTYNGLSTKTKLNMLVENKKLPQHLIEQISLTKQVYTIEAIENNITFNKKLYDDIFKLKNENYKIVCCSNALTKTVELGLDKLGVLHLFDFISGNESVQKQKPHPDIYSQWISYFNISPQECLIVEDSETGIKAANASGAHVLKVSSDTKETTYENIKEKINNIYGSTKENNK